MGRYRSIGDHGLTGDLQTGGAGHHRRDGGLVLLPAVRLAGRVCFPGPRRGQYSGAAGTGGRTASVISLVPGISALALLAFGLHR
jgi:hypothetical protein